MKKVFTKILATMILLSVATLTMSSACSRDDDGTNSASGNSGSDSNSEWVDLGLPSGVMWATHNIGANSPEDDGDYFAWGETQTKRVYNRETYKWYTSDGRITKYFCRSYSGDLPDNLTTLQPEDDAATANWGNGWRMPTRDEWGELIFYCRLLWTTQNGVDGCKITGHNGNSIFLPVSGYQTEDGFRQADHLCGYWSSSLSSANDEDALSTSISNNLIYYVGGNNWRYRGLPVRPVRSAR